MANQSSDSQFAIDVVVDADKFVLRNPCAM